MRDATPPTRSELRRFGLLVGGVFVGVFGVLLPAWRHRPLPLWPLLPGTPLLALALVAPASLKHPQRAWMALARVLGWINMRVLLTILFFVVITPMGMILRVAGRDPMRRRRDKGASYRAPSDGSNNLEVPY
jgi:hypothetical protein